MMSHRRQHPSSADHHHPHSLNISGLPLRKIASNSQYLSPVPSESEVARLSHSPLSTLESSPATSNLEYNESSDYYLPRNNNNNYSGNHQTVRAHHHQQQPSPRSASSQPSPSEAIPSLDSGNTAPPASWLSSGNAAHLGFQPPLRYPLHTFHKRNSSDSTVTSGGSHSPFTPVSLPQQPYIVDSDSHNYLSPHADTFDQAQLSFTSHPKSAPPSSGTITDSLFFSPQFQNQPTQYVRNHVQWENAMRQALFQQYPQMNGNIHQQNMAGNNGANSGSNGHLGAAGDRNKVPGLDRTMSDIYQDELYNPEEPTVPAPTSKPTTPTLKLDGNTTSPRNSIFSERLHAATQGHITARSGSPITAVSRQKSPFQTSSIYAAEGYPNSATSGQRIGSTTHLREQQKAAEAEAMAIAQPSDVEAASRTVSPKEVTLEYEPENGSQVSLFPEAQSPPRQVVRSQRPSMLNQELTQPDESFSGVAELRREGSSNLSTGSISTRVSQTSQTPQRYPFISRSRQQTSGTQSSQDMNPEFPAHLVSMDSTRSESRVGLGESQSQSEDSDSEVQRPANTQADTGTYTCTYHGCSQRFETPQRLQKHKREGHRQGTPSSGSENRNTQAGPHKCERINPTTGKPCNSVFSRPYDLTRHEDTIHNARKQKVRCTICTEEKTFSRSDALTRHMRVVHPDVEFPGKSKRGK